MNANFDYFLSHDLGRYAGDWVIIVKEKVVAHGSRGRMKALLDEVKKHYPKESFLIAKVPNKGIQIL